MFYVGCTKNIFAVFGEQNDDYQTNSQVTISMLQTERDTQV